MPEHISNSIEGQEVPLTGTDAREAIREKIARAIYSAGIEDGMRTWESWLEQFQSNHSYLKEMAFETLDRFRKRADAAIAAHLEALEQLELPEEVSRVGRETLLTHGRTLDDAFRAICAALLSPKTGGESHE